MRVNTTSEDIVQWRKDIEHLRNILSKHRTTTFGEDMGTTQVTPGSIPKNEKDELSSQRLNTQVTHLVFVEGNLTDNNPNNYEKVLEIQRTAVKWDNETYGDIMHVDCVENLEYGKTYEYLSKVGREFSHKYTHVMKTDDDSFINIPGIIR